MKKLIEFFQKRNLLVNLITLMVLVGGYISATRINKEGYPQVDRKMMYIATVYPGASPEEVELNVTIPLEESFKGVSGIKEYSSISRANVSIITIILDNDYPDVEKVKSDIRRNIDNTSLPAEVSKKPVVSEWKVSELPIMEIAVFSETLPYKELRLRAKDLKKKLLALSHVARVPEKAMLDREIKIKLDLKKLNARYISIEEVIRAIQVNNFEMTGGSYKDGYNDKIITVSSKFQTIKDVEKIILRSTFEGTKIYLRDVAEVEDSFEEATTQIRLNGNKGVALQVVKKETSDILKTSDAILKAIEDFKVSMGDEDLDITVLWEQADDTRRRLSIVSNNALIGLGLVLMTLLIFMNFRNAMWTALGIPFSVAFAMIILPYFNVSINSISLLGMIVVLGMVVDDAIVISENIYRHRVEGKSWKDAAVMATNEVAFPVITTVATTILTFIPLMNIKGVMGEFAKEIPLVVIFILIGSLFESLLILPNHVSHRWIKLGEEKPIEDKKFIVAMRKWYTWFLEHILKWRYVVVIIFIGAFAWSWYALFSGKVLKFVSFPTADATYVQIDAKVIGGQSLDYTSEKVRIIENHLTNYDHTVLRSFDSEIGEIGYPEKFHMEIYLTPVDQRKISAETIAANLKSVISNAGVFTNAYFRIESGGPPQQRAVRLDIIGNDNKKRREITDGFMKYFQEIEGTLDIVRSDEQNKKELKIYVDYAKAAQVGVSPLSIAQIIRTSYNGIIATSIQTPNEMVEYRVMLDDKYRDSMKTLDQLYVLNNQQKLIKLSRLVRVKPDVPLVSKIEHFQGDRNTIIELDVDITKITPKELYDRIKNSTTDFEKDNPGFRLIIGGEAQDSNEVISSYISSAIIGVLSIFLVLVLLFRSFSQAFLVILAVPFSFIGIAITLITHGEPLTSMALFGGVGLIGVVVNDSLVMVDYINSLKDRFEKEGMYKLVIEGAATRLRPVILTTVTTVAGLLPTAYGLGGRDFMIMPTTLVMAWGLLFATMLTLFLIPSLYIIEYEIRKVLGHFFRNLPTLFSSQKWKKWIKIKRFILILGLGLMAAVPLQAETNTILTLSLEEFVGDALINHPQVYSEMARIQQARSLQLQARAVYGFLFEGQYNHAFMKMAQTNNTDIGVIEQKGDQFDMHLAGIVPKTGTRLKLGTSYTQSDSLWMIPTNVNFNMSGTSVSIDSFESGLSNIQTYQPEIYLEFSQPLLKNWLGVLDQFPLEQANLNKDIQMETVQESIESIVMELYKIYFDWYLAYHQYKILEINVANTEDLLQQIRKKISYGAAEKSDLYQVMILNQEIVKARDLARINYQVVTHKLMRWKFGKLGITNEQVYQPEEELNLPAMPAILPGVKDSRQMKLLNLSRELLRLQMEKEKNTILPELNAVGRISLGHTGYEESGAFQPENFNPSYAIGLNFSYPLGENLSRGKIKEIKSQIRKWSKEVDQFERMYTQGVSDLLEMTSVYRSVLDYDNNLIKYSGWIVNEEKKKYSQGRSDLYLIIKNENDYLRYQIKYVEDYVQYKRVQLELLGLLDLLQGYEELKYE